MLNYHYEVITSTDEEKKIIKDLNPDFTNYIEMAEYHYNFLTTLIRRKKPKKILEIGVSQGGSSAIILNAIKDFDESFLYSIDYNVNHYVIKDKKTGYYMDNYPELKKKWKLFLGGMAYNFIDEIGKDIDFCLIDTVHFNPGEILDVLMVLPYLKDNATIVFHDTNLQYGRIKFNRNDWSDNFAFTNNLLMSAIKGKKLIPFLYTNSDWKFSNIGAIELDSAAINNSWDIFNLLSIKWHYKLLDSEVSSLYLHFKKLYGENFADFFAVVAKEMNTLKYSDEFSMYKNLKLTFWQKIFSTFKIENKRVICFLAKTYVRV